METKHAPAELLPLETVKEQSTWFNNIPLLDTVLNCLPDLVFIVNNCRQIVYANTSKSDLFSSIKIEDVLAKRPGEVLNCENAFLNEGGCGTSEICRTCGAVNGILNGLKGIPDQQEFRITKRHSHEAMDLKVFITPIVVRDQRFSVFAVADISDEKRKRALERIFFHDIINTAGGLRGMSELLLSAEEKDVQDIKKYILELSEKILEDILTQKELSAAEHGELQVTSCKVNAYEVMLFAKRSLQNHPVCSGKEIEISSESNAFSFISDAKLVRRVLVNLVKNALESTFDGGKIVITALNENGPEFRVWNLKHMPRSIQNQIFQRSFSTKGEGRGLGTYSIKLLTEKYLGGRVSFISREGFGTEFRIELPEEI